MAVHRRVDTKSYSSLHALVNGMFPAHSSLEQVSIFLFFLIEKRIYMFFSFHFSLLCKLQLKTAHICICIQLCLQYRGNKNFKLNSRWGCLLLH